MQASTDLEPASAMEIGDARVPGLTVAYHADLTRVGERALLTGIDDGRAFELSRLAPSFAAPGGRDGRPLADARLSRAPIALRGTGDGGLTIDPGASRSPVVVDGQPISEPIALTRGDLERGIVVELADRVVLVLHLLDPVTDTADFGLVGYSPSIMAVRREVRRVATFDVPVLIRGESGTGKELVARAIHDASARRDRPYLAVNLGAIPHALAAAELFGAVRGAYTGANQDRAGYFQRAHGGTLFLDEIGEAAPELQVLLLRCLESAEIQPVGADRPRTVDVRVISATDADLEAAIEATRFRAPLLYRLGGYVIRMPPLRERREDLGRLLVAFLRRELAAAGDATALDDPARPWLPAWVVARLVRAAWPGNVRQLANVVRQLVIANRGLHAATQFQMLDELGARATPAASTPPPPPPRPAEITDDQLVAALRAHRFSPEAAATALGIPRASIYRRIDRSTRVRKASELAADEIQRARDAARGDEEAMAQQLEVSVRALRRRMGELGLRT